MNEGSDDKLVNRFVVDLKCGFDMPLDLTQNMQLLPSVYCEVSYSAERQAEGGMILNSQASSTKQLTRNPVWNEQIVVPIHPQDLEYEYDDRLSPEEDREALDALIMQNGQFTGYIQVIFFDQNYSYKGDGQPALAVIEVPMSYLEPYKPVSM